MIYNAGERKDIRKAEKAARLAEEQRLVVTGQLMSTFAGRLWMFELLSRCHIFRNPFSDSDRVTAFACGEMNIGQQLLSDVMATCPDDYVQMMREANERAGRSNRNDRDNRSGGDDNDDSDDGSPADDTGSGD